MILNNLSKMIVNCCTGNKTQQPYTCTDSTTYSPGIVSDYYSNLESMSYYSYKSTTNLGVLSTRGLILGKGNTPPILLIIRWKTQFK